MNPYQSLVDAINAFILQHPTYTKRRKMAIREIMPLVERVVIEQALKVTNANQFKAADILDINRNTLRKRIKAHGIDVKEITNPPEAPKTYKPSIADMLRVNSYMNY